MRWTVINVRWTDVSGRSRNSKGNMSVRWTDMSVPLNVLNGGGDELVAVGQESPRTQNCA